TLGAYTHQEVPFEQVVEVLQPPRHLSHSPVFQVLLALQNAPQEQLQLPGLTLSAQGGGGETAQFDLLLSLQEEGERIVGELNYASDLFERTTVQRWVGHLEVLLRALLRGGESRVSALPLLSLTERSQLLEQFNATQAPYPQDRLIHEL